MEHFPEDLIEAFLNGEAVGVIGSGPSIQSGLPSWVKLLKKMINHCEQNLFRFEEASELKDLLNGGFFLEVAQQCRHRLGRSLYRDFIQNMFNSSMFSPSKIHHKICELPFGALLTTNYDQLLEKAYAAINKDNGFPPVYTGNNIAHLARLPSEKNFYVLKMHGDVNDIESIILTQKDYQEAIHKNRPYQTTLRAIFASKTLVFIGYGLGDRDLNLILDEIMTVFEGFGNRHFAFMRDPGTVLSSSYKDQYNIEIIPYKSKNQHHQLVKILSDLSKEIKFHQKGKSHYYSVDPPLSLRRPYKFLDYYDTNDSELFFGRTDEAHELLQRLLSHKLSIIFGSSGVGKTSLLKASIINKLLKLKYVPIYVRIGTGEIEQVLSAFIGPLDIKDLNSKHPEGNALKIIKKVHNSQRKIVIIFDQFERIFSHNHNSIIPLWGEFLKALISGENVNCHVLISVR